MGKHRGLHPPDAAMPVKKHKASDYLKTPEEIAAYLNAAIDDMDGDPRLLTKALRNVTEARGSA